MEIIKCKVKDLRDRVSKSKSPVIVLGGDEKVNRLALENKKVDILLSPELDEKKDSFHYKRSGLNQVLCKLAKKNDVAIGFDFCLILRTKGVERAKFLGRMVQNVVFCRKYKVKVVVGCFSDGEFEKRSKSTLKAFVGILGIRPGELRIL